MPIWKKNLFVCWFGAFACMTGLSQITPILPLYIDQLGIHNVAEIEQWSGLIFGSTFILSASVSPLWGQVADKYGRKIMLIRASLGMAIITTLMGFATSVYQLLGLRLIMGAVSGYISASITLVATQTPKEYSGWALGTLSTGSICGMLIGPLIGGYIAETSGIRSIFFTTGALLFLAFIASQLFVKETFQPPVKGIMSFSEVWHKLPNPNVIIAMFLTTFTLQLALMSIQPIITVYIGHIAEHTEHIALISGLVFSASGFASILTASKIGRFSDKVGPQKILIISLIAAGILFIPQAFVNNPWELMGLRFLLGITTAGLLPSINTLITKNTPSAITGRIYGFNQSAQFLGTFMGSVLGGQVAAVFGIHYIFFFTSALLLLNAGWVYKMIYKYINYHV